MPGGCQLLVYNFELNADMYRLLIGFPAFFLSLLPLVPGFLFLRIFTLDVFQSLIRGQIETAGRIEFV